MMDAAERALLEETVRTALAPVATVGAVGTGADEVLTALGWLEMLEGEPRDAIDVVFRALGAAPAAASILDDVVVGALGIQPRADLAVLLPAFGAWEPPGRTDGDGGLRALGLATARGASAAEMVVVSRAGTDLVAVTVAASAIETTVVRGIDPGAGFHVVRVADSGATAAPLDERAWDAAVALGRRAIATHIAGAARAMLELARTHALERVQFGRPVAAFQAVRHRLAETLVAIEALDATLVAAADDPNPMTAALAKAVAGRTARTVAAHCQQVLAGIGFTTDHPFHRYLKQTMVLEGVLGSADAIASDIGRQFLAARRVPTLIEL